MSVDRSVTRGWRVTSVLVALLIVALTPPPHAQDTQAATLTVVSKDGRRQVPTTLTGGRELIALDDLTAVFPLTVREDALAGGITVTYRGRTIVASADQPMASVDGRIVTLPSPAVRSGRRWLVPIEFIPRALAPISDQRIDLRRSSRLLLIGDLRVPRVAVRVEMPGPPTRAAVVITPQTPVAVTSDPTRLVLRVEADALDLTPPPIGSGLIESIRLGDQPNTVVISLRQASAPRTAITTADNTTRVAMEIPAAVAPAPEISKLPETTPPTTILPRPPDTVQGFTIVIDAGHGGDEVGVRGDGIEEKQLTLDVAHRLRSLVETRLGLRVILTRDDDRTVSIDERASSANNGKADMLVSLHANGAPSGSPAGAEVFFERLDAEGEAVRRTAEAAAISLPVVGGGSRIIDIVPWDLAQARHIGASSMLARVLEEELRQRVPMSDRPLQQGPLRLLSAANMPAALVEMAYLTNAEQAKNARGDEFRNAVAQAVFNAIVRFRGFLEEGNPGPPKPGGEGGAP